MGEQENTTRMQELEASGKKVSGGMHKFDSSEVDVEGGDATTDDFLDAFGFGGTDGDAATDGSTEEAGAAVMSDAAWKEHEEAELKAKQTAEAKKAAEEEKLEQENTTRMQELEASGKKVSGGMHKFDSS